jgi:DNA-directed RNA polymerase specialized sigma24 family protein
MKLRDGEVGEEMSMERFILWECELFGERRDVVSFLLWFKELSGVKKEEYLLSVMKEYGVNSEQFYFAVQGFIFYVMFKHGLYWDEDVFQEAFLSVLEKVKYWDKQKGNLLSFLYSLIRDKVSQKKYRDSVGSMRSVEVEEGRFDEDDVDEDYEDGEEVFWNVLLKDVSSKVISDLRGEVLDSILKGEDSVYRRVVLWNIERGMDEVV